MYTKREWIRFSGLGLFYAAGFHLLWLASTQLETLPNTISWYLPAGFRLAVYLLTPFRSWPFIYVIDRAFYIWMFGDSGLLNNPSYVADTLLWYVGHLIFVPGITMLLVWYYRKYFQIPYLDTVRSTVSLLVLSLLMSFGLGTIFLGRKAIDNPEFATGFGSKLFSFFLGDLVGILALLPIVLVGWDLYQNRCKESAIELGQTVIVWIGLIAAVVYFSGFKLNLDYYTKVLTILPAIYFSYRFGWRGAAISAFFICLMTYTSALYSDGATVENQFYIISMSMCCLFLGAAISEQTTMNRRITSANKELVSTNQKLSNMVTINRQLSGRLIQAQEQERYRLSRELHDDFGQRITEIKLKSSIGRRDTNKATVLFTEIIAKADELYQSLKNSLGTLRPAELDETGLIETLKQGDLAKLAKASGLAWSVQLIGDEPNLTHEQAIGLYRISQEFVNNTIKHANASSIHIVLDAASDKLKLTLTDDGCGFDVEAATEGFGLVGMKERALAIGGGLTIDSASAGTTVAVGMEQK